MPTYDALCTECGVTAEYLRTVDKCMDTPNCVMCGEPMKKVIFSAPKAFVRGDIQPFKSHVDGSMITNSKELAAHNARNNVVCLSDGYSEEKILAGDIQRKEHKLSEKERKQDIYDAVQQLKSGYKPEVHHE